ncbi:MAG TPA: hypothetical protein VNI01_02205 [Elusimicrobiota bacterium]|jgi:hypothetical protein|nr:hypothetical protein [Elusimicrobiota bacterium]
MSYRIRRIDPFWMPHPAVLVIAAIGLVVGLFGYEKGSTPLSLIGGVAMGGGVLVATRPAVSAVLGTLGVFGGLVTFVIMPNPNLATLSLMWRLVSTVFFALLYMVLMDALILVIAALYNFFGGAMNLGGISLDIEESGDSAEG